MSNFQELNKWYKELFQKDFPRATLTRWVQEEKIIATKENGRYNYDLESFKKTVQSNEYQKKLKGRKEKPENYIGKIQGNLLITGIVPNKNKKEQYKGRMISMSDTFYRELNNYIKDNPTEGNRSSFIVRVVAEYISNKK